MMFDDHFTPFHRGEKIRAVFLFQVPSFWPSWESVYYECVNDPRFDTRLVLHVGMSFHRQQMNDSETFLRERGICFFRFEDFDFDSYKPHLMILQTPADTVHRTVDALSLRFKNIGARIVYIPYGIELSDASEARMDHFFTFTILNAWRIYVISEAMYAYYQKFCPNREAVRVTGHPKFDFCASNPSSSISQEIEMRIGPRKVVLWKVHFPKKFGSVQITPNIDEYLDFATKVSDYPDLFFVFMPHPLMHPKSEILSDESKYKVSSLFSFLQGKSNVYIYTEADYRPALMRADAVIIDRSALMIEAALTGVPILYMHSSDNSEPLSPPIAPLIDSYYHGTSAIDICSFLQQFRNHQDPFKNKRIMAFRNCVTNCDGFSGRRIVSDMATSILSDQSLPPPAKLVVFGLGQLFEYYSGQTNHFQNPEFEIAALCDNNPSLWNTSWKGITVVPPSALNTISHDSILIFSERYYLPIFRQLVFDLHIDPDRVIRLDKFLTRFFLRNFRKNV